MNFLNLAYVRTYVTITHGYLCGSVSSCIVVTDGQGHMIERYYIIT